MRYVAFALLLVLAACEQPMGAELPDPTSVFESNAGNVVADSSSGSGGTQGYQPTVYAKMEPVDLDQAERVESENGVVYRVELPLKYEPAVGFKPRLAMDGNAEPFIHNIQLPGEFEYKGYKVRVSVQFALPKVRLFFRGDDEGIDLLKREVNLLFVYYYRP